MNQIAKAKKATNISLSLDVYSDAKDLGINVSQVCEQSLREVIRMRKEQEWSEKNAEFVDAYSKKVEEGGVALEEWRVF